MDKPFGSWGFEGRVADMRRYGALHEYQEIRMQMGVNFEEYEELPDRTYG
jgi:hypothetical protein